MVPKSTYHIARAACELSFGSSSRRPMSMSGQTRASSDLDVMSAVLLITDSTRISFNVAERPNADVPLYLAAAKPGAYFERLRNARAV